MRLPTALLLLAFLVPTTLAAQATLHYAVPQGWQEQQPKSSMRLAQFALPAAAGDPEPAQAVIFYFGEGQGGSVDANLERWAGQMTQAGNRPGTTKDGTRTSLTAHGLAVTVLDISGTYADVNMMGGSAPAAPARTGYRMKAAVIETDGGPYFVKLTGPARTIAKWEKSFTDFLTSASYK